MKCDAKKLIHSQAPRASQTMLAKFLAGLVLTVAVSQNALAADWQYCLAPSQMGHKVYISPPFPSSAAFGNPDSALDRTLSQSGISHDVVQCPRADDERSIAVMRQEAINFNRATGNEIINLDWKP
jgi:hypothetical protein